MENRYETQLPAQGSDADAILARLRAMKQNDIPWQTGKVLAYLYEPDEETKRLVEQAYTLFLSENGLDPTSFPSLLQLETEIVAMAAGLLGGDNRVVGNFTSGGTESIMLAVKTTRDYFRTLRPDQESHRFEIIVPETAHAAFHKAAHYLDVRVVQVPVNKTTYQVDPAVMEAAITPQTILLVGSSPCYPFGVVDPIPELAALAKKHGIFCHVDACVGGMYLPFLRKLGYDVPPFDFAVDGVTSMSCDFHKYGYAAKGASCVLYRNEDIRRHQIFSCASWSGYTIVNMTVLSSKTGGPMAGTWAILNKMGEKGYCDMVDATQKATQQFIEGVGHIPELEVLGKPVMNLVAVASTHPKINVFELADVMKKRGWHIQVQLASTAAREALHLNINRANLPHIPALIEELKQVIAELKQAEPKPPALPLDRDTIEMLMSQFTPELFDQMQQMLGAGDGSATALPDEQAIINGLLNDMRSEHRNVLLIEFLNRLFRLK